MTHVVLAWALQQPGVEAVLVGARHLYRGVAHLVLHAAIAEQTGPYKISLHDQVLTDHLGKHLRPLCSGKE